MTKTHFIQKLSTLIIFCFGRFLYLAAKIAFLFLIFLKKNSHNIINAWSKKKFKDICRQISKRRKILKAKNCEIIKMTPPANFSFYMLQTRRKSLNDSRRQSKQCWTLNLNYHYRKIYWGDKLQPKCCFAFFISSKKE